MPVAYENLKTKIKSYKLTNLIAIITIIKKETNVNKLKK